MASSYHLHDEHDSSNPGSILSSPRFDYYESTQHNTHDLNSQVWLVCSFGGKISPRLHDNRLRYVGGDMRMVTVHRSTTFWNLQAKLSNLSGIMSGNLNIKYQLPYEDLDVLISVSNDDDVENMIEEYDRFALTQNPRPVRLRLFLFNKREQNQLADMGSDSHGLTNTEQWFLDALDGSEGRLKPSRSETASFFGRELDTNDKTRFSEPKWKTLSRLSESGSEAPDPASSSFGSLPSSLPHVKTRPENPYMRTEYEKNQSNYFMEMSTDRVPHLGGHAPYSHHFDSMGQPEHVYSNMDSTGAGNACIVASVPIGVPCLIPYTSLSGQIPLVGYHQPISIIGHAYNPVTRSIREMDLSNDPDDRLSRGEHLYYR